MERNEHRNKKSNSTYYMLSLHMRLIIVFLTMVAVISCNNSEDDTKASAGKNSGETSNIKTDKDPIDVDVSGCYRKILQRDTFILKLEQTHNSVSGELKFDNFEKDGSSGKVHGIIEKNMIKLWYNFASEGVNSIMEVYFKIEGDKILRGVGPMDVKGDTSYFTDHSAIQYLNDHAFNKILCDRLSGK